MVNTAQGLAESCTCLETSSQALHFCTEHSLTACGSMGWHGLVIRSHCSFDISNQIMANTVIHNFTSQIFTSL